MNRVKNFLKNSWFYFVAFLVPWLIAVLYSMVSDGWITGNASLLTGDTAQQLVPFAYDLWDKIHNGQSLAYTWNVAGGCDYSAISGYLFSPFTLIMLACPRTWIPDVMQFIMLTKWALTAVAMTFFFYKTRHNTLREHKEMISLTLGLAFALGTSVFNYMRYIQFGDVTICFPLLLLLIEKMTTEKKWKLYYLVLTFCIFSNTYMAWGICLFLIIWFLLQLDSSITEKWRKFFLFAGVSVMSAASVVFLILPSLNVAQNRIEASGSVDLVGYACSFIMGPVKFLKQIIMFADIFPPAKYEPNIFISITGVIMLFFFLFIKMEKKRKVFYGIVFALLTASFFVGALSLVWHLFNIPNGVYHRFSNLYVFFLLFMLLQVIIHLNELRFKHIAIGFVVYVALFVYTFFSIENYSEPWLYLISILVAILIFCILVLYVRKSISYGNLLIVLSVVALGELCFSAYKGFSTYQTYNYSNKDGQALIAAELLEEATLEKGERVAVTNIMSNIPMIASKSSVSGFVSALNGRNQMLFDRLGMPINGKVEYTIGGASPLINLMMNVRYIASGGAIECSDATLVAERGIYDLHRVDRLAGLGYMIDEDIKKWNIYESSCFDIQNSFVKYAVGTDEIFEQIEPNITAIDIAGNKLERDSDYEKNGAYFYQKKSQFGNKYDSMQVKFTAEEDMDLYVFSISDFNAKIVIYIDGEMIHNDKKTYIQSTYHLENVKKGQEVSIVALLDNEIPLDVDMSWLTRFAKFNETNYANAYEKLSKNVYNIEQMDSDYVKGSIVADESGIMMTSIQAVDGFKVMVDGEKTSYEVIGGSLIGVPLEKGKHIVEFEYNTPTSVFGNVVSLGAFVVFLILCFVDIFRKKKVLLDEQQEPVVE